MHLPRTKLLVQRLRTAYTTSGSSLGKLAQELGGDLLTAQGLTEIFGGRASPTSEQVLSILEFLKDNPMSLSIVEPPKMPRESARDPSEPKTLLQAKEMLASARAEIAQLKAAAPTTPQAVLPPVAAAPKPARPGGVKSFVDLGPNPMVIHPETPVTELDHLRVALNQARTEEEKQTLYRKVKSLEAEQSGPQPRARLGGR